jgi:hypothetical protein
VKFEPEPEASSVSANTSIRVREALLVVAWASDAPRLDEAGVEDHIHLADTPCAPRIQNMKFYINKNQILVSFKRLINYKGLCSRPMETLPEAQQSNVHSSVSYPRMPTF